MVAKADVDARLRHLFEGRAESLRLFLIIRRYIESLGPIEVNVTSTQVSFGRRPQFAWVWLPQMWINRRPATSITLAFGLRRRLRDPLIEALVEPYPGRFMHHVIIARQGDLSAKVKAWLLEAYKTSKARPARRPSSS